MLKAFFLATTLSAAGATGAIAQPVVAASAKASSSPAAAVAPVAPPTPQQLAAITKAGLTVEKFAPLLAKPLYQMTEAETAQYIRYVHAAEPEFRQRIVHLARKNLGQPYELYLLGEMPFETHDPQPIYCLTKSDCLVYAEHVYAMALSDNWSGFMRMLQRLRYQDGKLGVATRNHYTEVDWNSSNRWLMREITADVAGATAVRFEQKIDRSKFLLNRYQLPTQYPVVVHKDAYLPFAEIARAADQLKEGDFVNVVRGIVKPATKQGEMQETFGGNAWVGHVGLITRGPDGTANMIHSIAPAVREESLAEFIARETADMKAKDAAGKARLLGFKFLRLEENPLEKLRQLDGADAPKVTLPGGMRL